MRYLLRLLLVLADATSLCLAFALGWYTRFRLLPELFPSLVYVEQPWDLYWELIVPGVVLLVIFAGREQLYRLGAEGYRRQIYGSFKSIGWLSVVFLAYLVLFRRHFEFSRLGTVFALGYMTLLMPALRVLITRWSAGLASTCVPTLMIGARERLQAFLRIAGEEYRRNHRLLAELHPAELLTEAGDDFRPEANERVNRMFHEEGLEKVVILMDDLPRSSLTTLLRKFEIRARTIKLVPDSSTMALMGARITRQDSQPLLAMEQRLWNPVNRIIKRGIDLTVALLAAPFVLLLIVLCTPFLGFRPLMRVRRYDLSGRPFELLQLRVDYEQGGLLFQTGLYKVPELLNVLQGRQSLVGPAPLIERELELYTAAASGMRMIRPGLTGLWQVSEYGYFDPGQRLGLDAYYAMNWSPALELRILLESLFKALWSLHRPRVGGMRS